MLMLLLTSINDKLLVVTGQAGAVQVHASYMDFDDANPNTASPGRKNTSITNATSNDVAGSPGPGVKRNVKTLHIRNADGAATINVTVQHTDGTTVVELISRSLSPGDQLQHVDGLGFLML